MFSENSHLTERAAVKIAEVLSLKTKEIPAINYSTDCQKTEQNYADFIEPSSTRFFSPILDPPGPVGAVS